MGRFILPRVQLVLTFTTSSKGVRYSGHRLGRRDFAVSMMHETSIPELVNKELTTRDSYQWRS